jgi:hypothetical protein
MREYGMDSLVQDIVWWYDLVNMLVNILVP